MRDAARELVRSGRCDIVALTHGERGTDLCRAEDVDRLEREMILPPEPVV